MYVKHQYKFFNKSYTFHRSIHQKRNRSSPPPPIIEFVPNYDMLPLQQPVPQPPPQHSIYSTLPKPSETNHYALYQPRDLNVNLSSPEKDLSDKDEEDRCSNSPVVLSQLHEKTPPGTLKRDRPVSSCRDWCNKYDQGYLSKTVDVEENQEEDKEEDKDKDEDEDKDKRG